MYRAILALLLVSLSACKAYDVKTNLSYDKTNVPFGVFDMYTPAKQWYDILPESNKPRPVILAIHGGAWQGGDKSQMHRIAEEFCPSGYVVLSINYRLSLAGPGYSASTWPAQIDDCQTALKYFQDNAGMLNINPNKIASLGISAGGHLATMLALRGPVRTTVAVDLDGEHDMTLPPDQMMYDAVGILTAVFGHGPPWTDAELKDISTITFARPDVSVFIVHGESDNNVYVINALRLNQALLAAGADVQMKILTGKDGFCHGDCWSKPDVLPQLHKFLDAHLKD